MTVVEIPPGSGNRYKYVYDAETKATIYKGPVGEAPELGEEEFLEMMVGGVGDWDDEFIPEIDLLASHWGVDRKDLEVDITRTCGGVIKKGNEKYEFFINKEGVDIDLSNRFNSVKDVPDRYLPVLMDHVKWHDFLGWQGQDYLREEHFNPDEYFPPDDWEDGWDEDDYEAAIGWSWQTSAFNDFKEEISNNPKAWAQENMSQEEILNIIPFYDTGLRAVRNRAQSNEYKFIGYAGKNDVWIRIIT